MDCIRRRLTQLFIAIYLINELFKDFILKERCQNVTIILVAPCSK